VPQSNNELQPENQLLQNILDRSGISYVRKLKHLKEPDVTESIDPDWGRQDLYIGRGKKSKISSVRAGLSASSALGNVAEQFVKA